MASAPTLDLTTSLQGDFLHPRHNIWPMAANTGSTCSNKKLNYPPSPARATPKSQNLMETTPTLALTRALFLGSFTLQTQGMILDV